MIKTYPEYYEKETPNKITELWKVYGPYRLNVRFHSAEDFAQVTMYLLGERFPLLWSKSMNKKQAYGAIDLFEAVGYYDMPL